jgi:urease accessory protein
MSEPRLPLLLHMCDSLFPTGGYAHSDGLEAATASGRVATAFDVQSWVDALLDGSLRTFDGPAVCLAWEHFTDGLSGDLRRLDGDVHAQRPSRAGREAARSVGTRLLKTWQRLYPDEAIATLLSGDPAHRAWTLPVAFGIACASAGVGQRSAVEAFLYTRVASVASTAMRLMPLGQVDAHAIVASSARRFAGVAERVVARRDPPRTFMPLMDIMSMQQQYVASRLFRS